MTEFTLHLPEGAGGTMAIHLVPADDLPTSQFAEFLRSRTIWNVTLHGYQE